MDLALEASIEEFSYPRGTDPAIRDIDLSVRRQEFVAVAGPAGSGKTTLCHCLTGVIPHFVTGSYRGSVRVMGQNLSKMRLPEIAPLVGFVQQRPENQLFSMTVEEDVAFGPENLCLQPDEIRGRIDEGLTSVGMNGFASRSPDSLSGGEAQRAVLGSVLAMGPDLLILDQPAAELDPVGRKMVYSTLCRLNREAGKTIVLVEDRLDDVLPFLTRVVLMFDGRIVRDEPPRQFFSSDAPSSYGVRVPDILKSHHPSENGHREQRRLLPDGSEKRDGSADGPDPNGFLPPAGREIRSQEPRLKPLGSHILEVRDLRYRYPRSGRWAVQGVSFGFGRGEFAALIGGNGAGKTTVAKQLAGLLRPTEGMVMVDGQDISREPLARLSGTVGYLFQDPDYQIVCNSVFDEAGFGLKVKKLPSDRIAELVHAHLLKVGLSHLADRHPYSLSRGQRQRLALASILIREPRVLVVDEPTTALDYRETIQMMEILAEFRQKGGTVIMVTHDLEMVLRYTRRSVVMADGEVVLDVATEDLRLYPDDLARASIQLPDTFFQFEDQRDCYASNHM